MSFLRLGKSDAGAAIIEALVATTLMGLALTFLLGSFSTLAIASRTAEQSSLAQATARAQAARINAAPYQANGNYSAYYEALPTGVTRSVTVTWWDYATLGWIGSQNAAGLEKIVLTMTYDSSPISSVEMVKANR
jgi:Tfp pilus assembly protein PilV